jgi:hypothetical protein
MVDKGASGPPSAMIEPSAGQGTQAFSSAEPQGPGRERDWPVLAKRTSELE